jgi:DNA-binding transcriptional MerR regulator
MEDVLGKLLGSPARVKFLRLFLFNPGAVYSLSQAADRAQVSTSVARRELPFYERLGLLKARRRRGERERAWTLNTEFAYLSALQHLLLNLPVRGRDIVRRLRNAGVIKLVILSGLFVDEYDGRLDLLVVGDKLSDAKVRSAIRSLEAELGKELRYAALPTEEFLYRLGVYDKLVRDVIDYPHTVVLDRLHIQLK